MYLQTPDPQAQARRALGKVYALLYHLAEKAQEQKTVDSGNPGRATPSTVLEIDPGKESIHA